MTLGQSRVPKPYNIAHCHFLFSRFSMDHTGECASMTLNRLYTTYIFVLCIMLCSVAQVDHRPQLRMPAFPLPIPSENNYIR